MYLLSHSLYLHFTTYNDLRSKALQSFKCLLWCSDRSFGAFTSVGSLWAVMNWNPSWFLQLLWPLGQEDVRTMYRKRRDLRLRNRVFRAHAPPIITNFDAKLASNQNDRLARKFPVKNHPGTNLSLTRDHFSERWRCKEVNVSFLLQICLKSKSEPLLTLHVPKTT